MKLNAAKLVPAVLVLLVIPELSYAYLDPGTGSFVLQMVVAALLGVSFTIKMYWKKIVGFFKKSTGSDNNENR